MFDGLPGALHQRESVNSKVFLCDLRVTYMQNNFVYNAFMNGDGNAVKRYTG